MDSFVFGIAFAKRKLGFVVLICLGWPCPSWRAGNSILHLQNTQNTTLATTEKPQTLEDATRILQATAQEFRTRNEVNAQSAVHPLKVLTIFLQALSQVHAFVPGSPGKHVSVGLPPPVLLHHMAWRKHSRIDHRVTMMRRSPVRKKIARKIEMFDDTVKGIVDSGGIVLVDGDNTRGKSDFELTHLTLLTRIAQWAHRLKISGHVVVLIDHGSKPDAYHLAKLAGISVAFSGPVTADDLAVHTARWFHGGHIGVLLVTADNELTSRCSRYVRRVVNPKAFLRAIGYNNVDDGRLVSDYIAASRTSSSTANSTLREDQLRMLESEMRIRTKLTRMDRKFVSHNNPKRIRTQQDLDEVLSEGSEMGSPSLPQVVGIRSASDQGHMDLSPDEQEAIMAALIQRRLDRPLFMIRQDESTYQRVVMAEVLRRRLERRHFQRHSVRTNTTVMSPAAEYVASFSGGKPKTSPLQVRKSGEPKSVSRNESGHTEGMPAPPVRPASNDENLSAHSTQTFGGASYSSGMPASPSQSKAAFSLLRPPDWAGKFPLRYLSVRSERKVKVKGAFLGPMARRARRRKRWRLQQYLATSKESQPPPLQSVQEPLRVDDANQGKWTRLVVLSETHGEEAMLTEVSGDAHAKDNLSSAGSLRADAFLPTAEVLVHCGGWSHGDGTKEKANAQTDFDTWLSKQPQRHKLIVRNQHDPEDATFPLSKAVYVTKPSSVQLANISFACMPYSRRPPKTLPKGDVVVTYQPPKYGSQRSLGSGNFGDESFSRAAKQSLKPRIWLFGHSNKQATGPQRVRLGTRSQAPTTMVNAANGDPGSNRQLVAGPVVLDVEAR